MKLGGPPLNELAVQALCLTFIKQFAREAQCIRLRRDHIITSSIEIGSYRPTQPGGFNSASLNERDVAHQGYVHLVGQGADRDKG